MKALPLSKSPPFEQLDLSDSEKLFFSNYHFKRKGSMVLYLQNTVAVLLLGMHKESGFFSGHPSIVFLNRELKVSLIFFTKYGEHLLSRKSFAFKQE